MKNLDRQNKAFVSELDDFLAEIRQKYPETSAQQFERNKYARIAELRDCEQPALPVNKIWGKF